MCARRIPEPDIGAGHRNEQVSRPHTGGYRSMHAVYRRSMHGAGCTPEAHALERTEVGGEPPWCGSAAVALEAGPQAA